MVWDDEGLWFSLIVAALGCSVLCGIAFYLIHCAPSMSVARILRPNHLFFLSRVVFWGEGGLASPRMTTNNKVGVCESGDDTTVAMLSGNVQFFKGSSPCVVSTSSSTALQNHEDHHHHNQVCHEGLQGAAVGKHLADNTDNKEEIDNNIINASAKAVRSSLFSVPPLRRLLRIGEQGYAGEDTEEHIIMRPKSMQNLVGVVGHQHKKAALRNGGDAAFKTSGSADANTTTTSAAPLLREASYLPPTASALSFTLEEGGASSSPPANAFLTQDPKVDTLLYILKVGFVLLFCCVLFSSGGIAAIAATDDYLAIYFSERDSFGCRKLSNSTSCDGNVHCQWVNSQTDFASQKEGASVFSSSSTSSFDSLTELSSTADEGRVGDGGLFLLFSSIQKQIGGATHTLAKRATTAAISTSAQSTLFENIFNDTAVGDGGDRGYCIPTPTKGLYDLSIQNIAPNPNPRASMAEDSMLSEGDGWRWYLVAVLAGLFSIFYGMVMRHVVSNSQQFVRRVMRLQSRHALGYRTVLLRGVPEHIARGASVAFAPSPSSSHEGQHGGQEEEEKHRRAADTFRRLFLSVEGLATPESLLSVAGTFRRRVITPLVDRIGATGVVEVSTAASPVGKGDQKGPVKVTVGDADDDDVSGLTVTVRRPIFKGLFSLAVEVPASSLRLFSKRRAGVGAEGEVGVPSQPYRCALRREEVASPTSHHHHSQPNSSPPQPLPRAPLEGEDPTTPSASDNTSATSMTELNQASSSLLGSANRARGLRQTLPPSAVVVEVAKRIDVAADAEGEAEDNVYSDAEEDDEAAARETTGLLSKNSQKKKNTNVENTKKNNIKKDNATSSSNSAFDATAALIEGEYDTIPDAAALLYSLPSIRTLTAAITTVASRTVSLKAELALANYQSSLLDLQDAVAREHAFHKKEMEARRAKLKKEADDRLQQLILAKEKGAEKGKITTTTNGRGDGDAEVSNKVNSQNASTTAANIGVAPSPNRPPSPNASTAAGSPQPPRHREEGEDDEEENAMLAPSMDTSEFFTDSIATQQNKEKEKEDGVKAVQLTSAAAQTASCGSAPQQHPHQHTPLDDTLTLASLSKLTAKEKERYLFTAEERASRQAELNAPLAPLALPAPARFYLRATKKLGAATATSSYSAVGYCTDVFRLAAQELSKTLEVLEKEDGYNGAVFIVFEDAACAVEYCDVINARYSMGVVGPNGVESIFPVTATIAGPPDELHRSSLNINVFTARTFYLISMCFFVWLVFFYSIPIAAIGSLSALSKLPYGIGEWVSEHIISRMSVTVRGTIQAYLPVIVLAIFNFVLPIYVRITIIASGSSNVEETNRRQSFLMFIFSFLTTVVFQAVLQGGFSQLAALVEDPQWPVVSALLVAMVSPSGGYWYALVIGSFIGTWLMAVNLGSLVSAVLFGSPRRGATSQREYDALFERSTPPTQLLFSSALVMMGIGILFHATVPILSLACGVFFFFAYVAGRGVFLDVYQSKLDNTRQRVSSFQMLRFGLKTIAMLYVMATVGLLVALTAKEVWWPTVILFAIAAPIALYTAWSVWVGTAFLGQPNALLMREWVEEDETNAVAANAAKVVEANGTTAKDTAAPPSTDATNAEIADARFYTRVLHMHDNASPQLERSPFFVDARTLLMSSPSPSSSAPLINSKKTDMSAAADLNNRNRRGSADDNDEDDDAAPAEVLLLDGAQYERVDLDAAAAHQYRQKQIDKEDDNASVCFSVGAQSFAASVGGGGAGGGVRTVSSSAASSPSMRFHHVPPPPSPILSSPPGAPSPPLSKASSRPPPPFPFGSSAAARGIYVINSHHIGSPNTSVSSSGGDHHHHHPFLSSSLASPIIGIHNANPNYVDFEHGTPTCMSSSPTERVCPPFPIPNPNSNPPPLAIIASSHHHHHHAADVGLAKDVAIAPYWAQKFAMFIDKPWDYHAKIERLLLAMAASRGGGGGRGGAEKRVRKEDEPEDGSSNIIPTSPAVEDEDGNGRGILAIIDVDAQIRMALANRYHIVRYWHGDVVFDDDGADDDEDEGDGCGDEEVKKSGVKVLSVLSSNDTSNTFKAEKSNSDLLTSVTPIPLSPAALKAARRERRSAFITLRRVLTSSRELMLPVVVVRTMTQQAAAARAPAALVVNENEAGKRSVSRVIDDKKRSSVSSGGAANANIAPPREEEEGGAEKEQQGGGNADVEGSFQSPGPAEIFLIGGEGSMFLGGSGVHTPASFQYRPSPKPSALSFGGGGGQSAVFTNNFESSGWQQPL